MSFLTDSLPWRITVGPFSTVRPLNNLPGIHTGLNLVAQRHHVNLAEGCLVTGVARHTNQLAHWVNAVHRDHARATEIVRMSSLSL